MIQQIESRSRSSIRPLESYSPPVPGTDARVRRLMAERPLLTDARFGCYRIADSSPYSNVARAVECAVFQEFFGNEPSIMTEEYADYEAHSTFLLVVDQDLQQAAGTIRIISHSENGLKTLNDIEQAPLSIPTSTVLAYHGIDDLDKCWEVGTLAVLKEYRGKAAGHLVSTMLYGMIYEEARKAGIEHAVTILDKHAYRQLTETLGIPFRPIAGSEPFTYLGSESSRAAYVHVPEVAPTVEAYLDGMDANLRQLLRPYLVRLIYAEGLPQIVEVA